MHTRALRQLTGEIEIATHDNLHVKWIRFNHAYPLRHLLQVDWYKRGSIVELRVLIPLAKTICFRVCTSFPRHRSKQTVDHCLWLFKNPNGRMVLFEILQGRFVCKWESGRKCIRLRGGGSDHRKALPMRFRQPTERVDEVMVVSIVRKETSVTSTRRKCCVIHFRRKDQFARFGSILDSDFPWTLLRMTSDCPSLAKFYQGVLKALLFQYVGYPVGDKSLSNSVEC